MRTESKSYSDYLEKKYLPGRRRYLNVFFYPKILRQFKNQDAVIDLGCGTGEFLNFCRKQNRKAVGVDSNTMLIEKCRRSGFDVIFDNVCELETLRGQQFSNLVCDNVLEHLEIGELERFFARIQDLLTSGGCLMCIVPGRRGFKKDPTHKTYVCRSVIEGLIAKLNLKIRSFFYHPINLPFLDNFFYLNMQVFEIRKD